MKRNAGIFGSVDGRAHCPFVEVASIATINMCSATTAQHSETLNPDLVARFAGFVSASPQPQIILGTQSVSRRAVVDQLAEQFSFKVSSITADIDEKAIRTPDPKDLVMLLAHAKADAIMKKLRDSGSYIRPGYLVTCDQVVVHNHELREKPESAEEARSFIRSYGEAPASTIGACVCTCLETGTTVEDLDICRLHMDPVPERIIDELIEEGGVFACAGGLMVEHPLVQPYVTQIEGTTEGIMGLSKEAFVRVVLACADADGVAA